MCSIFCYDQKNKNFRRNDNIFKYNNASFEVLNFILSTTRKTQWAKFKLNYFDVNVTFYKNNYVHFSKKSWNRRFAFAHIFLNSIKVLGFSVMLFYIFGKEVIFSKCSDFLLQYLFVLLLMKLMQQTWFVIYQIYKQHIHWANLV